MFDGVYYVQEVSGFELISGPLLSIWTPLDCHGKFFVFSGGEIVSYLLSLSEERLDGQGSTPYEAEADLCRKISETYDSSPKLQSLLRRI